MSERGGGFPGHLLEERDGLLAVEAVVVHDRESAADSAVSL
ncbi:hypothetical protein [uncultured Selenomonas sp.]|nr:hypothetical protein [uncultured Selenomonas sp.]